MESDVCYVEYTGLIVKSDSIWIAWVQEYVLKGKSFWEILESQSASWSWKKLLKLRTMCWKVSKYVNV